MNVARRGKRLLGLCELLFGFSLASGCSPSSAGSEDRPPSAGGVPPAGGGVNAGGGRAAGGEVGSGSSGQMSTGGADGGGYASGGLGASPGSGGTWESTGGAVVGSGGDASGGNGSQLDAFQLVDALGFGTNIGNTLENTYSWETGWGQPPITQEYIEGIARSGFRTVRVPVAWDTYATSGVIDADKLGRVKQVVEWIENAGMFAIVNIHWDGGWIFDEGGPEAYRLTENVKDKFASYWQQIASAFSSEGHQLIFEGLNEEGRFYVDGSPDGSPDYGALAELNQLFVNTVRAHAGYNRTRALLIAGFHTDIGLTCVEEFQVPNDPAGLGKLFLSIHYYSPYPFTLMDSVETWGSPVTTWGNSEELATLHRDFTALEECSNQKGLPIILGEFAVTKGENFVREPESRARWMGAVLEAARDRNIVPVLWDTGSDVSRSDGSLSPELTSALEGL